MGVVKIIQALLFTLFIVRDHRPKSSKISTRTILSTQYILSAQTHFTTQTKNTSQ